jgi:stage III sporulation protein AA
MTDSSIGKLFRYLPLRISIALSSLPEGVLRDVNEIRLRRNGIVSLTAGMKNLFFDEGGRICTLGSALRVTDGEIDETLKRLTDGSLYSFDEFVSSGFIPLSVGGRAGVCGRANVQGGKTKGFSEITSLNLRVHRFIENCASPLVERFSEDGILGTVVCSPPAYGKTTFLRSVAHLLASGKGIPPKRVAIADERSEISVGLKSNGTLDVLSRMQKSEAITLLTRTMSPEVIICDEIGAHETESVLEAQNSGVPLIASAHCNRPDELLRRGRMKNLLENGVFPLCVLLSYDGGYKCKICDTEDFL